jgi:nicotinamide riboside kinase
MIKRISILGTDKSNKTRLTKDLSSYFSTNFVIDYEDLIWRSVGKNTILRNHFEIIKSRKSLENWLSIKANDFLFFDTCDLHTIWRIQSKYPKSKSYNKIITNLQKSDLYLITKSDEILENIIKDLNIKYIILDDEYLNMREKSIKEIEKLK